MQVYQITTTCANCRSENRVIIADENASASCQACGSQLLKAKRFAGVIYVMSNPKVQGVKVGMTSRNVFARAKQISGTGVPGDFSVLAAFPSNNPNKDERKVHEKLSRKRIGKEHFDLDPVTAIVRIRTILSKEWVFLDRKHERPVLERLTEQKENAQRRFAGGQSGAPQMDMFDAVGPNPCQPEAPSAQENAAELRPKSFLANLFS
ncbi:DNA-directed RNA polymerase subunit RPC12/RpoP [Sphingomonas kaistensis]|uniref:DNA-directed RNA polymerase subunit RPC12/RpoP n=1 Tax=Sphingomonas kaistensis TaxID=298708 RepID=A0A7X5Y6R9_9SPHN|nr:GIY-YIG nuclease family protein [Sphingomonas kaistensis]NJC05778.1 DNA-directed RNA polymerase subunit RPC12/RpoP [Sphingomonas kaistensis]